MSCTNMYCNKILKSIGGGGGYFDMTENNYQLIKTDYIFKKNYKCLNSYDMIYKMNIYLETTYIEQKNNKTLNCTKFEYKKKIPKCC